jgi:type IV secretory pathway protease TraF
VPIGLYTVHPAGAPHVTELAVVLPPDALASFLEEPVYPAEGRAHVEARPRASSPNCPPRRRGITVDGIAMGDALDCESRGRPSPSWQGRQRIPDGDVFLMNWRSEASLGGRDFGRSPLDARGGLIVLIQRRPLP